MDHLSFLHTQFINVKNNNVYDETVITGRNEAPVKESTALQPTRNIAELYAINNKWKQGFNLVRVEEVFPKDMIKDSSSIIDQENQDINLFLLCKLTFPKRDCYMF